MRALLPVLLLCGCGLPPLTSEDVFGLEPVPRAWAFGVVTDAKSGGPIFGATLQMASASVTSDANGAFRFEGLTAGVGELAASREGFETLGQAVALKAGANRLDVRLEPLVCVACTADQVCDGAACVEAASLSGDVVDLCTGAAVTARVTIDGKSTCVISGKGYWQLRGLKPGGPQTIAVGKSGYQAYSAQVTLVPGFNAIDRIRLEPVGGCAAPPPVDAPCACTTANCQ